MKLAALEIWRKAQETEIHRLFGEYCSVDIQYASDEYLGTPEWTVQFKFERRNNEEFRHLDLLEAMQLSANWIAQVKKDAA